MAELRCLKEAMFNRSGGERSAIVSVVAATQRRPLGLRRLMLLYGVNLGLRRVDASTTTARAQFLWL